VSRLCGQAKRATIFLTRMQISRKRLMIGKIELDLNKR
jgi:hypothetical protein